jgi:hypothetical protein
MEAPMNQSTAAGIDLLRGILTRLEDMKPGAQYYLMAKVLPLLRREALDPNKRFRAGDLDVITRSLDELEHEAARVSPDSSTFGKKAQILVDVLALC